MLKGSDWTTRVVTLRNPVLESVRNRLAAVLGEFDFVRRRLSRGLSELGVNYRRSPIVAEDRASMLHALTHRGGGPGVAAALDFGSGPHLGDRAPDVVLTPPESASIGPKRLYEVLRGTRCHLLLFEGSEPTKAIHQTLATIGREVRDRLGRWIEPWIVIGSAAVPGSLSWDGPVIRDTDLARCTTASERGRIACTSSARMAMWATAASPSTSGCSTPTWG